MKRRAKLKHRVRRKVSAYDSHVTDASRRVLKITERDRFPSRTSCIFSPSSTIAEWNGFFGVHGRPKTVAFLDFASYLHSPMQDPCANMIMYTECPYGFTSQS